MDISTSYFTILSSILAFETILLFPCFLFTAILPPDEIDVEFPPPEGYSGTERKTVTVPKYPSCSEIGFLIALYIFDIILLYPYTREGVTNEPRFLYFVISIVCLGIQTLAAIGWSGIKMSWLAAERGYGLWYSKAWTCYYMSFILTGIAIGLPFLYRGIWIIVMFAISFAPTAWRAIYNAYRLLKFW
jgi:hypothetical protein